AMIINWPRQTARAEKLETTIRPHVARCDVLNSDTAADRPGWQNLGDAYGTEQFIAARRLAQHDLVLLVAADVSYEDIPAILNRALDVMSRHPIGLYAPNINWTAWRYDRAALGPPIEDDLYHVPETDGLVLFIRREILASLPCLDHTLNNFGWGIDAALIAIAQARNLWVCRDYAFTVKHPRGSGYDTNDAARQMQNWIARQNPGLRADIKRVLRTAIAKRV